MKKSNLHMTSLCLGGKISKSSLRMDALGDLDELIAILGIVRASVKKENLKNLFLGVQQKIIVAASEASTLKKNVKSLKVRITDEDVFSLEEKIKLLKKKISPSSCFICPGEDLSCAYLHLARAVSRRCERKIVKLFEKKEIMSEPLLAWMNRLSQYLFLLAQKK